MNAVHILQANDRPRSRPKALAGDKGCSCRWIREWLRQRNIRAIIPRKSNEIVDERIRFDAENYRQRNVVERCVNWLEECCRIGTRFEKLAIGFLAMLKLAIIEQYLRYEL